MGGGYAPPVQPAQPVYAQGVPVAAPVAAPWGDQTPADGDTIAWSGASTGARPSYRRRTRIQSSGGGPVLVALLVGALLAGGAVYLVLMNRSEPVAAPTKPSTKPTTVAVVRTPKATSVPVVEAKSNNIFGIPDQEPTGPHSANFTAVGSGPNLVSANAIEVLGTAGIGRKAESALKDASAFVPRGTGASASAARELSPSEQAAEVLATKDDEQMKTPEWEGITTAYYRDPLGALLRIDDYEKLHPGVLTAQLNTLRDAVVDRLWFERISQLWRQRESLVKELAQVDQALVDETNESYKQNTIIPKKKALQDTFNSVSDTLEKEMGYTAPKAPMLHDDNDLSRLRRYRVPDYYKQWKAQVLDSVHRRHVLPFEWSGGS